MTLTVLLYVHRSEVAYWGGGGGGGQESEGWTTTVDRRQNNGSVKADVDDGEVMLNVLRCQLTH